MLMLAQLFNDGISNWDVSRVNNVFSMFMGATSLTGGISKWNVSRVINMGCRADECIIIQG